ncbi:TonB-linked SusC/RagA family outer membrane protein [Rhabdobacter roseus]|uniref:TonB-linked SusC/RagA family outer membrane protein n=1 Tax=Rhabdobacter roseus TaxID=1655419 RepID=A0A840TML0_9BACT|nr:TonB-dependent receptor [Rhabdobacter roseus]MBB5285496.1 TonB-linked SusC/RagA family outer membrane protein [Rhabdobacter roseus]
MNFKETTLKQVLYEIERQSKKSFFYSSSQIDTRRKVSLAHSGTLEAILQVLFDNTDVSWQIEGKHILLKKKAEAGKEETYNRNRSADPSPETLQLRPELILRSRLVIAVNGVVRDDTNEPLPGVSIILKGTQKGTVTDQEGKFSMEVPSADATLVFSFVGYLPREITVGNQSFLEVGLQTDTKALSEVIVVGYGTVKKENLTSSISKIGTEAIEGRPISTLSEAFAGQLAGVRAQSTSGIPGQELQIRIRGVNTINGNSSPLYVIDGVPRDDMNDINPSDVASIQILKDASATAIYGARGANGVVLIETKQGVGKPTVSFDAFYGVQDPEKLVGMMNTKEWLAYNIWDRNETWLRQGGSMKDPMSARPANLQVPDRWLDPNIQGTDWQRAIFAVAPIQSYQVSVSGKNELGSVYMSGGYFDQDGVIQNTYYRRMNFRFNGTLNVSSRLKLGMNLSPSFSTQDDRETQGKETVIHHAMAQSPLVGLNEATRDWGYPVGIGQVYPNPVERLKYTTDRTNKNKFTSVVWGEYALLPSLTFRSQFGYNYNQDLYEFFQPGNITYNNGFVTLGNSSSQTLRDWSIQNTLSYEKNFGDHNLSLLAGQSAEDRSFFRIQAVANGWPNEIIETLNVATTPTRASTDKNSSRISSFFGRAGYNFREKYLINATLRRDGSSRFGSNHKWGVFPAVSAGWKINEEAFLQHANWLSLLKIRAAWGTSGNDRIGNYDYMSKLGISNTSWGDAVVPGLVPSNIENPDLKWESTTTRDFGLDISVFNNRIQFNFDYYINRTNNLLFNLPIPNTTGFSSFRTNIGSIQNRGWEIDLTTTNTTGALRWTSSLNLSTNKNKVLDMGSITQFTSTNWDAQFITRVGGPVSQFYAYRTNGILTRADFDDAGKAIVPTFPGQEMGNVKYVDQNGDGRINASDLVPYGNNLPDMIYGFTNRAKWRNFELSVLIQGQVGGDVLFLGQRQLDNGNTNVNNFARWVHAWKPDYEAKYGPGENPIPDYLGVDMSWDGETPYTKGMKSDNNSDFRIYDATFLRIRNIALNYTLPKSIGGRSFYKGARLYVSVDNLKTFDNYPGVTPETNSFGNATTQAGVDYSTYPLAKKYTVGINVTF